MPSSSKKQHRLMEAVAHSPEFAKKVKIPQSVGKEFAEADKGRKFRRGGTTNPSMSSINKQQTHHGSLSMPNVSLNKYIGKKEGGMAQDKLKKLFKGKETRAEELKEARAIKSGKISPEEYASGEEMEKGMKKGGKCYAKGGYVRAADGIAQRGKTKGTMV